MLDEYERRSRLVTQLLEVADMAGAAEERHRKELDAALRERDSALRELKKGNAQLEKQTVHTEVCSVYTSDFVSKMKNIPV